MSCFVQDRKVSRILLMMAQEKGSKGGEKQSKLPYTTLTLVREHITTTTPSA